MHCVERFRAAFGSEIPLSFSGGIDQHNFADAVACDLVPVTTCTDLLRPGGYGRLSKYLTNLEEAMLECGARDRDELILRRFGRGAEAERLVDGELEEQQVKLAPEERRARVVRMAGVLNSHEVAARVTGDPRYAAGKNGKPPRKVGSQLVLLDCLSCDKCVPVCPNDANFSIDTPLEELAYEDVRLDETGAIARAPGGVWTVRKPSQWANYADACNECGNCDVFCPEDGGPYVVKARFFGSRASFDASPSLDGLHVEDAGAGVRVVARVSGRRVELAMGARDAVLSDGRIEARYAVVTGALEEARAVDGARGPHLLPGAVFATLRALVRGALDDKRVNPVSAAVRARWPFGV
jgi:putative selenate reductase